MAGNIPREYIPAADSCRRTNPLATSATENCNDAINRRLTRSHGPRGNARPDALRRVTHRPFDPLLVPKLRLGTPVSKLRFASTFRLFDPFNPFVPLIAPGGLRRPARRTTSSPLPPFLP